MDSQGDRHVVYVEDPDAFVSELVFSGTPFTDLEVVPVSLEDAFVALDGGRAVKVALAYARTETLQYVRFPAYAIPTLAFPGSSCCCSAASSSAVSRRVSWSGSLRWRC